MRFQAFCQNLKMIVKKHRTQDGRLLLAVCDSELLGKVFEEGERQLDLGSDFFNGEEIDENAVLELMNLAYMINIVGKKSVDLAIQNDFVSKEQVLTVQDIPSAQVVNIIEE